MTRTLISFASADMSALARSLRQQLVALGEMPSHVQLLNMLAKAGGYRNFQHLKAETEAAAAQPAEPPAPPPPVFDEARVSKVAGHFGPDGEMLRWPSRTNHQELCAWVLWSHYPTDDVLDERNVSAWLNERHEFGDAALLRRTMVDMGLLTRTQNGREYRRADKAPPPELAPLLRRIAARAG